MTIMRSVVGLLLLGIVAAVPVQAQEKSEPSSESEANLVETLQDHDQFSTLVSVAQEANMASTLASDGTFTILAPTDEAFSEMDGSVKSLSKSEKQALLRNHLLNDPYPSGTVAKMDEAQTVKGDTVSVKAKTDSVVVGGAAVVDKNIEAGNGIIHAVDDVLVPASVSSSTATSSSSEQASQSDTTQSKDQSSTTNKKSDKTKTSTTSSDKKNTTDE